VSPLFVRQFGEGEPPVVVLHGGWGYAFYPFDDAIRSIPRRFVIPDRTGYGRSPRRTSLPHGFHAMYAEETAALLDELGIGRCVLWGHSDGAVIAALLAIGDPTRYAGVVLEALHLDRAKPRSRAFFTMMAKDPDGFGPRVTAKLEAEHGPDWRTIIRADGEAWLDIAATPDEDMFGGRLHELRAPILVLHGSADPRTEPGELDRLYRDVPHAEIHILDGAGHAPHSEPGYASTCTQFVRRWLDAPPS
jgi:pimeloyl-ACP methyl ester carboxylesterase